MIKLRVFLLLKNVVKEMGSFGVLKQALNVTLLILNHKTNNVVKAKASIGAIINVWILLTQRFVVNHIIMLGVLIDHLDRSVL